MVSIFYQKAKEVVDQKFKYQKAKNIDKLEFLATQNKIPKCYPKLIYGHS